MCQCLREWLKVSVMISEQLRNHNNYIPIEQTTFQLAAAGRTEDCNSWSKADCHCFNLCLTHFSLFFTRLSMSSRSDEDDIQLPSDPNYITLQTDRAPSAVGRAQGLVFQGFGFEPDLFPKAYYMPFSCRWQFETKLRIFFYTADWQAQVWGWAHFIYWWRFDLCTFSR